MKKCIALILFCSLTMNAMEESSSMLGETRQADVSEEEKEIVSNSVNNYYRAVNEVGRASMLGLVFSITMIITLGIRGSQEPCNDTCLDLYVNDCKACPNGLQQKDICFSKESISKMTKILNENGCKYQMPTKESSKCRKNSKPNFDQCPNDAFDKVFATQTKREAKKECAQKYADSKQMMKQLLKQTKRQTFPAPKTKHKYKGR